MNKKYFFTLSICVFIFFFFLSILISSDSNSNQVKKMVKNIMQAHTDAKNNNDGLFTSRAIFKKMDSIMQGEDEDTGYYREFKLDSITYIGHGWFKVSYDLNFAWSIPDDNAFLYWKIKKEDDKFKLDDVAYTYSQCTSQIKDLPYVDRIKCWFSSIKYDEVLPYFQGNICKVKNDDKYGFINIAGKEIIPCKYEDIAFVLGDSLKLGESLKIDVESLVYDDCLDSLLRVKLENKYGLINLAGKEIIPCKYDNLILFDDFIPSTGTIKAKLENKYGLIELRTGKEIIPCKYDDLTLFGSYIKVKSNNKYGLIDGCNGKEIIPCKYDDLTLLDSYRYIKAKLENKYGLINGRNGKEITPCKYDDLALFDHYDVDYFKAKVEDKYGLIDFCGKKIFSCEYDDLTLFDEYHIKVKSNNKYGLYDIFGKEMLPCKYDYIKGDSKRVEVRIDHIWSYYKISGGKLTEFYEDVYIKNNSRNYNNSINYNNASNSIKHKTCSTCNGTGRIGIGGGGIVISTQSCPSCFGNGYISVPSWLP